MRLRPSGTILAAIGLAAIGLAAGPAVADESGNPGAYSEEDLAAARALFEAGSNLLEAGSYEDACRTFEASLQRVDGLGTRGKLAECYEKLGRIASAWRAYRALAAAAKDRGDKLREQVAARRLKVLQPRLPFLSIDTSGVPAAKALAIQDNGEPVPDSEWNRKRAVDPGSHYIAVTLAGEFYWARTVEISEGKELTITLPAPGGADQKPPTIQPPDNGDDRSDSSGTAGLSSSGTESDSGGATSGGGTRRVLGLGIAGAGGVALAVGAVFGVQARNDWTKAKDEGGCNDNGQCMLQRGVDLVNDARTKSLRANVALGVGAVAVITGGLLWWTGRGAGRAEDDSPRVTIAPSPHGPGVVVHGRF